MDIVSWPDLFIGLAIGFVLCRMTSGRREPEDPERMAKISAALPAEARAAVQRTLAANGKIEAIRQVRANTGLSLKDAKQVVESIAANAQEGKS